MPATKSASMRRLPKRSESQPPNRQKPAETSVVHRLSHATWGSSSPSSTARLDCSASPSAYAPMGRAATPTPTKASRLPVKARAASRTNWPSSRPTARVRDPAAIGRGGPGGSRMGTATTSVMSEMTPATMKKVGLNPMCGARKSTPDPPTACPRYDPPNIIPLARPRSFSSSTFTASASMATSCVALKMLWTKRRAVKRRSWRVKSTGTQASSVTTMSDCAIRIHIRRRPQRSLERTSTKGPYAHLMAHGRKSDPTNAPMTAGSSPWRRIWVAIAVAVKP